jgi:hypothetical protein
LKGNGLLLAQESKQTIVQEANLSWIGSWVALVSEGGRSLLEVHTYSLLASESHATAIRIFFVKPGIIVNGTVFSAS